MATSRTPTAAERQVWSVSQFVGLSRDIIEETMPFVWVRGEVSRLVCHASGHWYFTLKDEAARVPVAMFARANSQVPFDVEDGMELIVGGQATIYVAQGKFQIIAEVLEPEGWGALQLAYEQLKARLAEEGLFDAARKRRLPLLPRCVGVVTSASGAAWRDMTRVWQKNEVPLRVILSPARVQGDGAAAEIVAALARLDRHGEADVIIVGRGGGSREDLWAFNEEPVARAIAACSIPVVSAVGHEIDQTIADLVADARAATPTAAAELVAASRTRLVERLDGMERRATATLSHALLRARNHLQASGLQRSLRQPARLLRGYRQRLDEEFSRLTTYLERRVTADRRTLHDAARLLSARNPTAMALRKRARAERAAGAAEAAAGRILQRRRARLAAVVARIEALSPLAVLGRGYSITRRAEDGVVVRCAGDVASGDRVTVRLAEDTLDCTVDATHERS
ncbi:MAG: exodeoxyribonuclease VII large subunit [Acidobacteriota bacterium]|jgi:exodeoxyribonuclease VII large subunit